MSPLMLAHALGSIFAMAQATPPTQRILFWSAVMVGFLLVAFVVITLVRRRHRASAMADEAPPFSISSLRQMHEEGTLSDEEYERARQVIIAKAKGAMERNPPVMPPRKPPEPPPPEARSDDDLGPELLGPDDKGPPPPPGTPQGPKE